VNHSGTAAELLAFAREIQNGVFHMFGVVLEMEPAVIGAPASRPGETPV